MHGIQLTDVESTNLHQLCTIRLALESDPVTTSSKFGLNAPLAERLRDLSHEQMWTIVAHVGQTTLFPPRQDLLALLDAPIALAGALAAAQPPRAPNASDATAASDALPRT